MRNGFLRPVLALVACIVVLGISHFTYAQTQPASAPATPPATSPATPDDGQWTMPTKNHENTRYSGLDQIKLDNVKDLRVAWTFSTGTTRGMEAAPIVVGTTMYIMTPYPNVLYALDLTQHGM